MDTPKGKLYLIPTTLGESNPLEVLPLTVRKAVEQINHYVVEHEKSARRSIQRIAPGKSQPDLHLQQLNKFTDPGEIRSFLDPCLAGFDVGIISDAGCPGIADPGAAVVALAHEMDVQVVPLVGPSSILLAMMASGMNGQKFAFHGYLPIDKRERRKEIKQLERDSKANDQAQLFIETPYRNEQLMEALLSTLLGDTRLCVAADITLPTEYIKTLTVDQWKKNKVDLHKRPTLFIIQNN
ncbi:SAM-dependent methyltransferase [Gilvibacter sp.]|uniref:SAM-dependent methyltransferase n=1 Tax=Gilvibacter sp. TaxID=2729997 RepID=UPI003F49CF8D